MTRLLLLLFVSQLVVLCLSSGGGHDTHGGHEAPTGHGDAHGGGHGDTHGDAHGGGHGDAHGDGHGGGHGDDHGGDHGGGHGGHHGPPEPGYSLRRWLVHQYGFGWSSASVVYVWHTHDAEVTKHQYNTSRVDNQQVELCFRGASTRETSLAVLATVVSVSAFIHKLFLAS